MPNIFMTDCVSISCLANVELFCDACGRIMTLYLYTLGMFILLFSLLNVSFVYETDFYDDFFINRLIFCVLNMVSIFAFMLIFTY